MDAATIGISEHALSAGNAFPVPADRELRIPFRGLQGQCDLQVLNAAGEVVSAQRVSSSGNQLVVNVAGIAPGAYSFRVSQGNAAPTTFKVVIAH